MTVLCYCIYNRIVQGCIFQELCKQQIGRKEATQVHYVPFINNTSPQQDCVNGMNIKECCACVSSNSKQYPTTYALF